jgi:hypothetical protein
MFGVAQAIGGPGPWSSSMTTVRLGRAQLHAQIGTGGRRDTPNAILAAAQAQCLDVVAITDPDSLAGALAARDHVVTRHRLPELIRGAAISSRDGRVLGLFLQSGVASGMSAADTVSAIHAQGGLAIATRPWSQIHPSHDDPTPFDAAWVDRRACDYTLFPGRTTAELRAAIVSGLCLPGRRIDWPTEVDRYLALGLVRVPPLLNFWSAL